MDVDVLGLSAIEVNVVLAVEPDEHPDNIVANVIPVINNSGKNTFSLIFTFELLLDFFMSLRIT